MSYQEDCPYCVAKREGDALYDYVRSSIRFALARETLTADVKTVSLLTAYRAVADADRPPTDEEQADLKRVLSDKAIAWHWRDHPDELRPDVADDTDERRVFFEGGPMSSHPAKLTGRRTCSESDCQRTDIELVARTDRHVVALCPAHRKEYLGVSS